MFDMDAILYEKRWLDVTLCWRGITISIWHRYQCQIKLSNVYGCLNFPYLCNTYLFITMLIFWVKEIPFAWFNADGDWFILFVKFSCSELLVEMPEKILLIQCVCVVSIKIIIIILNSAGERHFLRISGYSRKAFPHMPCTWEQFYRWGSCNFLPIVNLAPPAQHRPIVVSYILPNCKLHCWHLLNQIFLLHWSGQLARYIWSPYLQVSSFNTCARGSSGSQIYNLKSQNCSKSDFIRWKNCQGRDFTINGLVLLYFHQMLRIPYCRLC